MRQEPSNTARSSEEKANREGDFGRKAKEHCGVPMSGTCCTRGQSEEVAAIVTSDM